MKPGILLNLYEDEKVVLVIRRHWLAFVQSIFITSILLLVFAIGAFVVNSQLNAIDNSQIMSSVLIGNNLGRGAFIIFSSIYLLSTCAFFYISWLDYYLDVFVITNKRILRIEQLVLFRQNISETSLQHIQNVSSKVKGIIYTILNVGTVFVETAGERANFNFTFIKDPGEIATRILELQKEMWGDEGFKEDLTFERMNEKIGVMNTGNNMMEEKTKEKEIKKTVLEEQKNKAIESIKNVLQVGMNKLRPSNQFVQDDIASVIENTETTPVVDKDLKNNEETKTKKLYNDGRRVTPEGVIWQSEQEVSQEVLETLNEMEE